ncbi:oxidoreductase, partial [Cronobacter sakazakii]
MSDTDIRVVPGPANYFSYPGALARLHDFYTPAQLARAVWIYGERAIAAARPFLSDAIDAPGATRILFRGHCSESDVSALAAQAGDDRAVVIGVGGGALLDT